MKAYKKFFILLIIPMMFMLCGLGIYNTTVLVDTEKNHIYEYITADDLLTDFANNKDTAADKYEDGYYLISGKIEKISKKGDKAEIFGTTNTDNHILCSCPKNLRSDILTHSVGDEINVFGKITVDSIDKEIHIDVEKLISIHSAVKDGTFYLLDGTNINKNSMVKRTLNDETISFYIPSAWKEVENSIVKTEIGTIDGYQYVLNQLPGNNDSVPESFFVCYFDNTSKLENADDKKETKLIEKAIINNISGEGKGNSARTRDITTYYGSKYNYYVGSYDVNKEGYRVEYIFQKNDNDGLVMYLYVYKNAKHLSDVMFVTRFLEINSK